ncbi:MAG: hypothetical protein FJZ64_00470 [Chlamydiae bacterium]|nr:hypothetical protein [Chlamydiota bacterium]
MYSFFAVSLLLLLTTLHAEPISDASSTEIIGAQTQNQTIPASATPTETAAPPIPHFSVYVDILFWGTNITSLPYSQITGTTTPPGPTTNVNFRFNWNPGFRVGASYHSSWRDFFSSLEWTRFHISTVNEMTINTSTQQTLMPWMAGSSAYEPDGYGLSNHATYDLNFDQIDWVLRKEFIPAKDFTIAPFGGVRSAWIHSNFKVDRKKWDPPVTSVIISTSFTHLQNNLNAIGLIAGLENDLDLGLGFDFFMTGDTALLFGTSKSKSSFGAHPIPVRAGQYPLIINQQNQITTVLDLTTGFDWKKAFQDWEILFKIAYEAHLFFNYPNFFTINGTWPATSSILSFQGLAFEGAVSF